MFLQYWTTCWCRRPSVGQTIRAACVCPHVLTIRHQLLWSHPLRRGNMWCKVLTCFVFIGSIRPGNITISLIFGALNFFDFFVFLVKISRLYSFIKIKLSKLPKLQMSHPTGSLYTFKPVLFLGERKTYDIHTDSPTQTEGHTIHGDTG